MYVKIEGTYQEGKVCLYPDLEESQPNGSTYLHHRVEGEGWNKVVLPAGGVAWMNFLRMFVVSRIEQ